ncbi:outer membrane family protein [Helicobacter muridarum]|nr:outer membrane family protein [Helicobacter muridarum]STQ86676.1 putative outer membrane protein [Helicobacter muridarum]
MKPKILLFTYIYYPILSCYLLGQANAKTQDMEIKLVPAQNPIIENQMPINSVKSNQDNNGLFIEAEAEIFNKTAFSLNQRVPNNGYGYFLGMLSIGYNYGNFSFVLGGVGAGLAYDSTKNNNNAEGLGFNYVGSYPGYLANREATNINTHNYLIHNAYIGYDNSIFKIKVGRFLQEDDDWYDSYAEGISVIYKFANKYHLKIFGSSTYALVGQGWLNDFSRTYFTNGLLNAEFGYNYEELKAMIYIYYGINEFISPGFNIEVGFGDSDNIYTTTKLTAIFPVHQKLAKERGFFVNILEPKGFNASILLRQDVEFFEKYLAAIAFYKNIGNANARMALFGNPIGIDIWDNSIYTEGASLNASVAPDAFSALLFTRARYENIATFLQQADIGINARYTYSPSNDEYSLSLFCDLGITKNLSLSLILNYYTTIIKNELLILDDSMRANISRATFDRSYLISRITYSF